MEQYIKKSALLAEINRAIKSYDPTNEITSGRYTLVRLRNFIDTLEVKGVDLEKEVESLIESSIWRFADKEDFLRVAKHFYKLGLKAQKGE